MDKPDEEGEKSYFAGQGPQERMDMIEEAIDEFGTEDPMEIIKNLGITSQKDIMFIAAYLKKTSLMGKAKAGPGEG
jgi:hypothetical protein